MRAFAGWSVVTVRGPSMAPTLRDGDRLLVSRVRAAARLRPGSVVVAVHPRRPEILVVKRAVRHVPGGWWLLSDNALVTSDSSEYGAVADALIEARAVLRLRDPLRVAWIRRLPVPPRDGLGSADAPIG